MQEDSQHVLEPLSPAQVLDQRQLRVARVLNVVVHNAHRNRLATRNASL